MSPRLDNVPIDELTLFQSEKEAGEPEKALDPGTLVCDIDGGRESNTPLYVQLQNPQIKTVRYMDEEHEMKSTVVDDAAFRRWIDASCLVSLTDDKSEEVRLFQQINEDDVYAMKHQAFDIKAGFHSLIATQKLEFGVACERILKSHDHFRYSDYRIERHEKRSGKPCNPYAYRYDARIEVDFFALNDTSCVVGSFQLTEPRTNTFVTLIENVDKLRGDREAKIMVGILLAGQDRLKELQRKHGFALMLARSGNSFSPAL